MFCHPIPNTTTTNMSYPKAINLVKQFIYQSTKDGVSDTRHQKVPILRTIDNDNILNSSIKKNAIAINTAKQERLCNSLHLGEVLYSHCCPRECITRHLKETPLAVEEHLRLWSSLPQNVLSIEIAKILDASQVENSSDTSVKLQGRQYELHWRGVPLCRNAFQLLYGVSRRKLIAACHGSYQMPHGNSFVDHENTLTISILNFLDDIKQRCGSECDYDPQKVYLNGFYEKRQVWKHYVDTRRDDEDVASDSHFFAVWSHHRPNVVVETDAMKCATCAKLDILMTTVTTSEEQLVTLKADKLRHKQIKKAHLDRMRSLIARAKSGQLLLLIGDHMRSKGLPKLKRNNMNILMSELINIHFSGWFNPYTGKSRYYLFPEHWSETANSIISCLHSLLKELNTTHRKLVLVFDNHSTQHNNALLAYCDWLVRYQGAFDEIEVLFLIAGHTKNQQDQMNSYVAGEYMRRQFFSIADLCTLGNDKREFSEQQHILQWTEKLAPLLNEYKNVSKAHVFVFSPKGLKTKEFVDDTEWNTWNDEPAEAHHLMLRSKPQGSLEPMQPYQLSDKKKSDAKASMAYIPPEHRQYITNLINNNFGYTIKATDALHDFNPTQNNLHQQEETPRPVVFRQKRKRTTNTTKRLIPAPAAICPADAEDQLEPGEVDYLLQSLPPDEHFEEANENLEDLLTQARKKQRSTKNL